MVIQLCLADVDILLPAIRGLSEETIFSFVSQRDQLQATLSARLTEKEIKDLVGKAEKLFDCAGFSVMANCIVVDLM